MSELHLLADVVIGSLMASAIRLIVTKAFLEPAAVWIGRKAYRTADQTLGGSLPDWISDSK